MPVTVNYNGVCITGNLREKSEKVTRDPGTGEVMHKTVTLTIEIKNVTLDPPKEGAGES